jgi:2-methylcitrate dehydratase PrpD
VTLGEFSDEVVSDPGIQELIAKIDYSAFEKREEGYSNVTTLMNVRMKDGREFSMRADFGKGNPKNPMNYDDLADKFRGCAAYAGWQREKTEAVVEMITGLENLPAIGELTRLLVGNEGGSA